MEITGLGWCGTRTGRCSELAHFYEHVPGPMAGDGENLPACTVTTAASGQQQVRVGLKWNLRGTGTQHAAAAFRFFTPDVISARSASFTCKPAS